MASGIEHERHRFSTMSESRLYTRLSRITKSDKLLLFGQTARTFGYDGLADMAAAKFATLYGYKIQEVDKSFVDTKIKVLKSVKPKGDKPESVRFIRF